MEKHLKCPLPRKADGTQTHSTPEVRRRRFDISKGVRWFFLSLCLSGFNLLADVPSTGATNSLVRVSIVENAKATVDFQPDDSVVQTMVQHGITNVTGLTNPAAAWLSLVSTQDVIGVKVFAGGGEISGTRPAVVAAVVRGLIDAGVPRGQIILWDKHEDDLRAAGFIKLGKQLGVRVAGCVETGYDPTNFYLPDSPIIGNMLYGDLEFGMKGEGVGRKSFVSKLVSRQITKIISIAPLLNQNEIGVFGHLYSLGAGSVDNTFRFEGDADRLAIAVPEICALPAIHDKLVLNITDALLGQYEGGNKGLLHYSDVLNQLWFSRDPVALDTMAVAELIQERLGRGAPMVKPGLEIYTNASLLELGVLETNKIFVQKIQ